MPDNKSTFRNESSIISPPLPKICQTEQKHTPPFIGWSPIIDPIKSCLRPQATGEEEKKKKENEGKTKKKKNKKN